MADSRTAHSADEIRERTNIVEIIAPHVSLKRAGKRLVGLCPFHPDKAPSFTVDPDKGLWHCFGCGAGGNVFHFLMRAENLTFPEAARKLAERLGVDFRGRRESDPARGLKDLLARINAEAASFFRGQLEGSAPARDYLKSRALTDELIARFRIGWAPPEWDKLYGHLRRQGYHDPDIEKSGLCVARPRADGCYDRFRGRIMFPILDLEQRVIGFGGRILEGGGGAAVPAASELAGETPAPPAKYINSPETPLFHKGRTLYAFPLARKAMGERGRAIVVEGYFDAIACHAAGFTETVATLGTALTQEHLEVLRRHTSRVYAAYDSDSAGMKAILRSQGLFEAARLEVWVVRLPPGADPDSLLAENGPDALAGEIENAVSAMDYRLAAIAASHPDTEEGRLAMMQEAVDALAELRDAVAQAHYIRRLAERCCRPNVERVRLMEQALHQELRKRTRSGRRPTEAIAAPPSAMGQVERQVLAAMLQSDVAARWLLEELSPHDFCDERHRRVFETLRRKTEAGTADIKGLLASEQEPELCALWSGLALAEGMGACSDAELRQAVERMREWRDSRRCKELLEKANTGELSAQELTELTELRRGLSRVTARRIGEDAG
jgi:DNA primase